MTIENAKKVKELILLRESLKEKLGILNSDDVQILVSARHEKGMYTGYPFEINLKDLEISDKELIDFTKSKIQERINAVESEIQKM